MGSGLIRFCALSRCILVGWRPGRFVNMGRRLRRRSGRTSTTPRHAGTAICCKLRRVGLFLAVCIHLPVNLIKVLLLLLLPLLLLLLLLPLLLLRRVLLLVIILLLLMLLLLLLLLQLLLLLLPPGGINDKPGGLALRHDTPRLLSAANSGNAHV